MCAFGKLLYAGKTNNNKSGYYSLLALTLFMQKWLAFLKITRS